MSKIRIRPEFAVNRAVKHAAWAFAAIALGLCAPSAFAISGDLNAGNSNWSGNVQVTGNVNVPAGVTLTIAPGTHIRADGTNYTITATGPMKAVGTLANYVDFYGVAVALNNAASQHDLEYCVFITSLGNAVGVNGASAKLSHILIQDFGTNGISITGAGANVTVDHCTVGAKSRLFGGADAVSLNIGGGADQGNIDVSNDILGFENKPGLEDGLVIKTAGGAAAASATVKVHYNLITGTRTGTGAGETGNITGTDADVKDIPNLDYHLWPYSAAINAGDPAGDFSAEPAPNGGRVDLGYYGGTAEATSFQFRIVAPNGGDSLAPGASATVKWQGGKLLGAKKLDFSIDNGATWQPITASADAAGAGTYAWTVPQVKSPNCLVRVSMPNGDGLDQSDRVFTIGDTVGAGGTTGPLKDPTVFRCVPFTGYRDGQAPGGAEPTQDQVKADLQLIKQWTREIRTYGSGAGTHGNFLPALCDQLGMKIHMGIWLDNTYTEQQNQQSIADGVALAKANHPSIKTVIVGNEFLLRVRQSHGDVVAAEAKLVGYIKQVRAAVPAGIVVGTGESYPDWLAASDNLYNAVDKVIWHVHPWWEQKSIDNAANHAYNVYLQMKARVSKFPGKPMVLGETGWPTAATTGAAVGSEQNQAKYLHDLHAWAKKEGLDYWFFTNVDEKWKGAEGDVGAHWGMYNSDRTPKYIIGHLDELVPAATRWENDPSAVGIRIAPAAMHAAAQARATTSIYDLQGRLIGAFAPGHAEALSGSGGDSRMLSKSKQAAQGVYLIDSRL